MPTLKDTYPLTTHRISTAAFTSIYAMYGSGKTYTRWLYAGKNRDR